MERVAEIPPPTAPLEGGQHIRTPRSPRLRARATKRTQSRNRRARAARDIHIGYCSLYCDTQPAREDVSGSPSRPPPRLAEGLDPSFRDLLESWCAARLRSTNDAVAVLADVSIPGRPSLSHTPLTPPLDASTLRRVQHSHPQKYIHISCICRVCAGVTHRSQ